MFTIEIKNSLGVFPTFEIIKKNTTEAENSIFFNYGYNMVN